MKLREGFVSNSSSSSYIITIPVRQDPELHSKVVSLIEKNFKIEVEQIDGQAHVFSAQRKRAPDETYTILKTLGDLGLIKYKWQWWR